MKSIIVDKNSENSRLDKILFKILNNAPSSFVYKMLRKKNIVLNGKKADGKEILKLGDEIKIFLSDETFDKFHKDIKIDGHNEYSDAFNKLKGINLCFENDDFMCVYKPSGVLTQKAMPSDLSLNEWCIGYLLDKGFIDKDTLNTFKPSVLNRLDRNTCGLVLASKSLKGSTLLSQMIKERSVLKFYKCVVTGDCQLQGTYKCYMDKDSLNNKVSVWDEFRPGSKEMITGIKPLRTIGIEGVDSKCTELEIELITGKTHQIRAHLSHLGYPLLGDIKYGGKIHKDRKELDAQYLCAYNLRIIWEGEEIDVRCKTPWG